MKTSTIAHRLDRRRTRLFGRDRELALLRSIVTDDDAAVVHLHGPFGIGKSALLDRFEAWLRRCSIHCVRIRGAEVEPTPRGLLAAFANASAAEGRGPVLIIDDFDALRLADAWLRRDFIPALPAGARIILAGRLAPQATWTREFGALFLPIPLGPLEGPAVMALAEMAGLDRDLAQRVHAISAGHPLCLAMALQAARAGRLDAVGAPAELAEALLADAGDVRLRRLAKAAAVVRRLTRPLAVAMLGDTDAGGYADFLDLPFVRRDQEGAHIAEPVRRALAERLAALEPARHAGLRDAAAQWITACLETASAAERWRYMADLLYLVPQPQIRNAFFPPDAPLPPVEPAEPADLPRILAIAADRLGAEERRVIEAWLQFLPHRFCVARDETGEVIAFYICGRATDPVEEIAAIDPLLRHWKRALAESPVGGEVLFLRRLVTADPAATAAWSACVLDVKRLYLERWSLARVYTAADAAALQSPVLRRLGFRPLIAPCGNLPGTMVLDLPGAGLIGWISALVGVPAKPCGDDLDFTRDRREVVIAGRAVRLTRLEADVLAMLIDRAPAVVSREDLIEAVWRRAFVGSNVVDAVIRTLRRKLGAEQARIVTVPKAGYRFADQSASTLRLPSSSISTRMFSL